MIPAIRKETSFPVLLPREVRARPRARPRRRPMLSAMVAAALIVLPPIAYVGQQTVVAQTGYRILRMRTEIARLEREGDRLEARLATLRAPDRIERIAVHALGMAPPTAAQRSSLRVARSAPPQILSQASWWRRLGDWFLRGEAEASEARP